LLKVYHFHSSTFEVASIFCFISSGNPFRLFVFLYIRKGIGIMPDNLVVGLNGRKLGMRVSGGEGEEAKKAETKKKDQFDFHTCDFSSGIPSKKTSNALFNNSFSGST
jgi:hypothetical protein